MDQPTRENQATPNPIDEVTFAVVTGGIAEDTHIAALSHSQFQPQPIAANIIVGLGDVILKFPYNPELGVVRHPSLPHLAVLIPSDSVERREDGTVAVQSDGSVLVTKACEITIDYAQIVDIADPKGGKITNFYNAPARLTPGDKLPYLPGEVSIAANEISFDAVEYEEKVA